MPSEDFHPSESELLLYTGNELSSHQSSRIRSHLAACERCRAQAEKIETTMAALAQAQRQAYGPKDDIAGPRALLKARLAVLVSSPYKNGRKHSSFPFDAPILAHICAYACALAILTAIGIGAFHQQGARWIFRGDRGAFAGSLPVPNLTPGSTRQVSFADLCSSENDEVVKTVPGPLRKRVFQEYGIENAPAPDYEVDYLITPGLGGSDDIRNLWPEPHNGIVWNSYVKDQLENRLHQMVCNGTLSLAEAQRGIAGNWISAYKKYFHTDRPLPEPSPSSGSHARISSRSNELQPPWRATVLAAWRDPGSSAAP